MKGKYFYIHVLIRVVGLIGLSVLATWLTMRYNSVLVAVCFGVLIILLSYQLILYFDKISKKVSYFFNAIENEDSTFFFPEKVANYSFRELNKSLNKVNELIREEKVKNREQEQYYGALLEQVDFGIVVVNANGNILQANSVAKKLLNYKTLTHIVQLKRIDEALYEAFSMLKNGSKKLVNVSHNNTTRQLILRATSFVATQGTFSLISVQDIRSELEAKESESWIKLIRVLTHEIMNSISPITSLSDTLLGYYTDKNTVNEQTLKNTIKGLRIIKERGNGLMHFVASYRQLTKIPTPVFKTTSVDNLVRNTITLLESEPYFSKVEMNVEIEPKDMSLDIDETQISQVMINLLKNALQALVGTTNPQIKIKAVAMPDGNVEMAVIDNGKGISKELMEHIFIPFFTTKENGSGIGLSLSQQIMRNHGGYLKADSVVGEFARFTLVF